jgi:hypothetical protein
VNYSKPPIRAPKTHDANENALKSLRPVFGSNKLLDIDANQIEFHLRARLQQKRCVHSEVRGSRTRKPASLKHSPGVSDLAANLQRGSEEETGSEQSLQFCRVSGSSKVPLPAALHDLVRAVGN